MVYAKPPFGGPEQALAYLGRYTHRIALSNERILDVSNGEVTFQWKNYRHKNNRKSCVMTIPADEFIRRFLIHTISPGFQRIPYFGFLANRYRCEKLVLCRQLLNAAITELLPGAAQCTQLREALHPVRPPRGPACGSPMIRLGPVPAYRWPARPPDSS